MKNRFNWQLCDEVRGDRGGWELVHSDPKICTDTWRLLLREPVDDHRPTADHNGFLSSTDMVPSGLFKKNQHFCWTLGENCKADRRSFTLKTIFSALWWTTWDTAGQVSLSYRLDFNSNWLNLLSSTCNLISNPLFFLCSSPSKVKRLESVLTRGKPANVSNRWRHTWCVAHLWTCTSREAEPQQHQLAQWEQVAFSRNGNNVQKWERFFWAVSKQKEACFLLLYLQSISFFSSYS